MDKLEKLARSYDPGRHAGTNLSLKQLMSHPVLQPRDFQAIIYEDFHITLTVREIKDTVVPLFGKIAPCRYWLGVLQILDRTR